MLGLVWALFDHKQSLAAVRLLLAVTLFIQTWSQWLKTLCFCQHWQHVTIGDHWATCHNWLSYLPLLSYHIRLSYLPIISPFNPPVDTGVEFWKRQSQFAMLYHHFDVLVWSCKEAADLHAQVQAMTSQHHNGCLHPFIQTRKPAAISMAMIGQYCLVIVGNRA